MQSLLVLTPVGAVLALAATAAARRLGRWVERSASASFAAAVDGAMAPKFAHLERKLDDVQAQNRADHGAVAVRMSAVESELVALESRLAAVEVAINREDT